MAALGDEISPLRFAPVEMTPNKVPLPYIVILSDRTESKDLSPQSVSAYCAKRAPLPMSSWGVERPENSPVDCFQ